MTTHAMWQIASAVLLASVLAAGLAWYERTRPPARMVAAVAVLVAFAVIGRILFAPFPNVKPTTDIVIIAGFALGFAPGWIVGSLTALVSNFYFLQGPWTPWQMFAWGLCGLLGALVARLSRGNIGRVPFALVCATAGLGFGMVMNLGSAINLGGSDIVTSFWVFTVRSLPFDIAHAAANFVFFLIAGPLLIRMLQRLRDRHDVIWPVTAPAPTHSSTVA
ncbi:MAG: hypothetical protein ACPGYP_03610 [Solirubrobacterales bacterium]